MKKAPSEIGEVEGEVVDANKIETALRSVGIALRDESGQFRDLGQVFLELNEKWDSLDKNTARYIATIAAGSRQQSRFIAMMGNYARTQELVTAAQNSAGASQEQFNKTLDSLEAKLNQLSNAWDSFSMSIVNSDVIKFGIDLLTNFINVINKLTDALPGPISGFAKLGIAIGGLKIGGTIFDNAVKFSKDIGPFAGTIKGISKTFKDLKTNSVAFFKGFGTSLEFSEASLKAFEDAQKAGLSVQEASIFLTNTEAAARAENTIAAGAEAGATFQQVAAQEAENEATGTGLALKLKAIAALLFSTGTKKANAMVTLNLAQADQVAALASGQATVAQLGLNAAIYACPIGWIIAAIAAVVLNVILVTKVIKEFSSEAVLGRLNDQLQNLQDQLKSVNDELKDLKETKTELEKINKGFEELTTGTKAWKDALVESNQKVLDLISAYPELIHYIERGAQGQLSLQDAGWDMLLKQRERLSQMTSQAALLTSFQSQNVKLNVYDNLGNLAKIGGTQLNQTISTPFSMLGGILKQIWNNGGALPTRDQIAAITSQIEERNNTELQLLAIERQQLKDESKLLGEQQLSTYIGNFVSSQYDNNIDQLEGLLSSQYNNMNQLMSEGNLSLDEIVGAFDSLEKAYKAEFGISDTELGKLRAEGLTDAAMQEQIRASRINKSLLEKAETFNKILVGMDKAGKNLVSKDGLLASVADLEKIEITEGTNEQGILKALVREYGEDFVRENYEYLIDNVRKVFETRDLALRSLNKFSSTGFDEFVPTSMSGAAIRAISNQITLMMTERGGAQTGRNVLGAFSSVYNTLGEKEQSIFSTIINSTDFQNYNDLLTIRERLEKQGVEITDEFNTALNKFIVEAKKAADATRKIDFETFAKDAPELSKIIKGLRGGSIGRTFSEDQYNIIKTLAPEVAAEMQQGLDGRTYVGGSISDLTKTLENILKEDYLKNQEKLLTQQIKAAEALEDFKFEDKISSVGQLMPVLTVLKSAGVDLGNLGIDGLTNDTTGYALAQLSNEQLLQIYDKLKELVPNLADNTNSLNTIRKELSNQVHESGYVTASRNAESIIARARELGVADTLLEGIKEDNKKRNRAANVTERARTMSELAANLSSVNDLMDIYNNLESKDLKIDQVNKMLEGFGFTATEGNYNTIAKWLGNYLLGDYESFINIIKEAGLTDIDNIKPDDDIVEQLKEFMVHYIDDSGKEAVRLITEEELQSMVEQTGTKSSREWKNPYDWLYNMNERINKTLRERNLIQKDYEYYTQNQLKTGKELLKLTNDELSTLKAEEKLREEEQGQATWEINKLRREHKEYNNLYEYDSETGQLAVKYNAVNAKFKANAAGGEKFTEFIDKLVKYRDAWAESTETLKDIRKSIDELNKRGRQEFLELENQVKEALFKRIDDQITNLQNINTSINEANQELVNGIQNFVNQERQNRQNAKTEQSLADKQRRLTYLQMDSSGANALEVMKLEKELADESLNYEDSLIDQAIQKLQDDNEIAQKQREEQIRILEGQRRYYEETGTVWKDVEKYLAGAFQPNGDFTPTKELMALLEDGGQRISLSKEQKEDWDKQIALLGNLAAVWKANKDSTESVVTDDGTVKVTPTGSGKGNIGSENPEGEMYMADTQDVPDDSGSLTQQIQNMSSQYSDLLTQFNNLQKQFESTIAGELSFIWSSTAQKYIANPFYKDNTIYKEDTGKDTISYSFNYGNVYAPDVDGVKKELEDTIKSVVRRSADYRNLNQIK